MLFALRFRSVVLLAASAAASPAFAQTYPAGVMPGPGMPVEMYSAPGMSADPFSGGAYAVPTGAPISVAYGDAMASPGTIISGPSISGPTPSGGPVYMAPQVIGGDMMSGMPGSPGCNCGPGGTQSFDPSMMGGMPMGGMPMGGSYGMPMDGMPMGGPTYGGMPGYADPNCGTGCCLTDCCLLGGCFSGTCLDPCGTMAPPVCDPCQPGMAPGMGPGGGIYHGAGGTQRCGWAAGFSWVFLKPHYSSNDAFSTTAFNGPNSITSGEDFDYSLDLSPRVFVEYVGRSDTGIRATWFGFGNESDDVTATVPANSFVVTQLGTFGGPGSTVTASSDVNLDTIDFDLTHRLRVRKWLLNVGGGLRWASYEHNYNSLVTGGPGGTTTGDASRKFNGFGPTLFAEWRRPIAQSQFSFLANFRGSVAYGESESRSITENAVFGSSVFSSENDDFVAIGESQLGIEWSAWVSRRSVLFVQTAFESQYWLGLGTATDQNDDLGLYGFNTTVGLEW